MMEKIPARNKVSPLIASPGALSPSNLQPVSPQPAAIQPIVPQTLILPKSFSESFKLAKAMELVKARVGAKIRQ